MLSFKLEGMSQMTQSFFNYFLWVKFSTPHLLSPKFPRLAEAEESSKSDSGMSSPSPSLPEKKGVRDQRLRAISLGVNRKKYRTFDFKPLFMLDENETII